MAEDHRRADSVLRPKLYCAVEAAAGQSAHGVKTVDPKSHRLTFQCAGRVAVEARRLRRRIGDFGSKKILALAVADPGNADRRIDRRSHDRRFAGCARSLICFPFLVELKLIHTVFFG